MSINTSISTVYASLAAGDRMAVVVHMREIRDGINEIIDGAPANVKEYSSKVLDKLEEITKGNPGVATAEEFKTILGKYTVECLIPFLRSYEQCARTPVGAGNN